MRQMTLISLIIALVLMGGGCPQRIGAAPVVPAIRIALVIGNSTYLESGIWPDLKKGPLKDAQLMRKVLTDLNFDVVYKEDATYAQMELVLMDFRSHLLKHPGALALVYYSGHGAQGSVLGNDGSLDIQNFLIPANTELRKESEAREKAVSQDQIENVIHAGNASTGVIILDACRDRGFERDLTKGSEAHSKGMAPQGSTGMFVVYAAQSGRAALNTAGEPSAFTRILASELVRHDSLTEALFQVGEGVQQETKGAQIPDLHFTSVRHDISLGGHSPAPPPVDASTAEAQFLATLATREPSARLAYCQTYPERVQQGVFSGAYRLGVARFCSDGTVQALPSEAVLAQYLQIRQRLIQGSNSERAEIHASIERVYKDAPTPAHQLSLALALATPDHPGTDYARAQRLLQELLIAAPTLLLPGERALAVVELKQIDNYLTLEEKSRRLAEKAAQAGEVVHRSQRSSQAAH
jgi:hypothetical protein